MPASGDIRTYGRFTNRHTLEAEIIRLRQAGWKQQAIADNVRVSTTLVWKILRKGGIIHERVETWSVLTDLSGVARDKHGLMTKQQAVDKLIRLLELQRLDIAVKLNRARRIGYKLARKSDGSTPSPPARQ